MKTPSHYFYCCAKLAFVISCERRLGLFRAAGLLHATKDSVGATLLAIDHNQTPQAICSEKKRIALVLGPFGYNSADNSMLIGFNGERLDLQTGCYPLGAGQRNYSPSLMRFQSCDTLSPFSKGGLNGFAYCSNDPVNYADPSGHNRTIRDWFNSIFRSRTHSSVADTPPHSPNAPNAIVYGADHIPPPNYFDYGEPPPPYLPSSQSITTNHAPSYQATPRKGEAVLELKGVVLVQVKSIAEYRQASANSRNQSLSISAQSRAINTLRDNVRSPLPMQTDNGILAAIGTAHQLYDINGAHSIGSRTPTPDTPLGVRRN
jgi:RHS repeat-associated protein